MYWANFLHIYQPADQLADVFEAVVAQSYRPLFEGLKKHKRVNLTLNINGSLFELFDKYGHGDLIDILRYLGKENRIEFTSSTKYHALLPFLNEDEIIRQIKINDETNKFFLGDAYKPRGFFPPEMAYGEPCPPAGRSLPAIISSLGFEWIILDEIAYDGHIERVDYKKIYKIAGSNLKVFFRERRLSNLIMSAVVRSRESLLEAMVNDLKSGRYILTGMDGETFGHHRPGLEKMLFEVFSAPEFELIKISDIPLYYGEIKEITPVKSTWASSRKDIEENNQFFSWSDPENIIHKWQREFLELVLKEVYAMDKNHPQYDIVRKKTDLALSSDHFWWASAKPWWSLEMIEAGAYRLLDAIKHVPDAPKKILEEAVGYYEKIIIAAFNWQRTGKIRQMMKEQKSVIRIPFKNRTVGRGGAEKGVYWAFIDMIKQKESEAAAKGEYEKAILWRDAVYKFENKLDIYDAVNAIDLLRMEIPHKEVEKIVEKYKNKYREIRGGQPEQRGA